MLETSQDFLNIILAISILGFVVCLSLACFYLAMILRQGFKILKEMRDRINKIDELMNLLQEKIKHSASYLYLIGEGIKKLVEIMKEKRAKQ